MSRDSSVATDPQDSRVGKDKSIKSRGKAPPPVPSTSQKQQLRQSSEPSTLDEDEDREAGNRRGMLRLAMPSWLVSMVVHAIVLMILAFLTIPGARKDLLMAIGDMAQAEDEPIEDMPDDVSEPVEMEVLENAPTQFEPIEAKLDEIAQPEFKDIDSAPLAMKLTDFSDQLAPKTDLSAAIGTITGKGLEGRSSEARARMVREAGGSKGSEEAVAMALKWLKEHQHYDGGWDFDHRTGGGGTSAACQGKCDHHGEIQDARIAATAMALLPFLGAGQTHKEGKYKKNIQAGLAFLIRSMKPRGKMGDLTDRGGRMYSHGLASITLTEAYTMTRDSQLAGPAQYALNFIVYAQDPVGGGWRYQPRQAGDTSVVGWQLMALKSGHMGYLSVPKSTITKASRFLDAVQSKGGSQYGYTGPGGGDARSAIGLLSRMYLGWKKDNKALQQGIALLGNKGPNSNLYYDYYATQVMRHYGGDPWKKWNGKMRDYLVDRQEKKGHAKGSWYIPGSHSERGGRLYCTSLSTMILEVYYRHLPIYNKAATEDDFPL